MPGPGGDDGRRYRIVRRLGHGGMAEVFEGVLSGSHGFTRRVAIKRISTRAADDPEMAERFLDEARIASQLHHAGIVGVIDYGFVDGLPFQVLEFVDGLNADQLLDRAGGKLPADIALMIAADVAHALDHAHRAIGADGVRLGIVHRDVKPANVLVSWDGDVKLSDFGIAVARGRVAVTEAGVARGTPWFMAPEQRTKSAVGPRTDVFALGCTLHALLTGKSPLVDFEVAMRVISGEPPPLAPEIPPDVRAVIARACAPRPDERFADCAAFADALGPLIAVRLDRDARGRMREFLTGLTRPAASGGLLDQLLGVDLVLAGNPAPGVATVPASPAAGSGPTREFTLRATQGAAGVAFGEPPPMPPELLPPAPAPAPAPPPVEDEIEPDAKRRRRLGPWIALAILLAGTGATVMIAVSRGHGPTAPPDAAPVAMTAVLDAPAPAAAPDASAAVTPDASPAPPVDARPDRPHRSDGGRRDRPDAHPGATVPAGTGYLVVSGPGLVRAQILVDGQARGYAPNPIEVDVGRHSLEIVKADGSRLGPTAIEVTPYHTLTHPLHKP